MIVEFHIEGKRTGKTSVPATQIPALEEAAQRKGLYHEDHEYEFVTSEFQVIEESAVFVLNFSP